MVRKKSSKRTFSFHNFKLFSFLGLLTVATGVTYFLTTQQQDLRQRASGENFLYVAPTGDDSNNGSLDAPFASINKAAAVAAPGSTVVIMPGNYNETVITYNSGTKDQPIKFTSQTRWGAKINAPGTTESTQATWENNGDYVEISGFDISGGQRMGILNRGSHVLVHENYVHDIADGYCQNLGGAGISSAYSPGQRENTFTNNLIERVSTKPCSYVHGIYIQAEKEVVANNVILNVGGIGVACTHACNAPIIANNTIVNNGYGIRIGWSLTNPSGRTENALVANNIIAGSTNYSFYQYLQGLEDNNNFTNNLFFGNRINNCSSPTGTIPYACHNSIFSDPLFVHYSSTGTSYTADFDFRLTSNSPAVNSGYQVSEVSTDFDSLQRPANNLYDIGAFEYGAQISQPPTDTPPIPTQIPTTVPTNTPSPTSTPTILPAEGTVNVTKNPSLRAKVRIINSSTKTIVAESYSTITKNLPPGNYYVSFNSYFNLFRKYKTPPVKTFAVYEGRTTKVVGNYNTGKTTVQYK